MILGRLGLGLVRRQRRQEKKGFCCFGPWTNPDSLFLMLELELVLVLVEGWSWVLGSLTLLEAREACGTRCCFPARRQRRAHELRGRCEARGQKGLGYWPWLCRWTCGCFLVRRECAGYMASVSSGMVVVPGEWEGEREGLQIKAMVGALHPLWRTQCVNASIPGQGSAVSSWL